MSNATLSRPVSATPSVPTSFVTDDGTVIPAANIVIINGGQTEEDNVNEIQVIADPDGSNSMVVELTNRFSDTVTCGPSTTTTLLTFALGGTPAGYRFNFDVIGIDTIADSVCGYNLQSTFKTLGGVAAIIGAPLIDADEEITANNISMTANLGNVILTFTNSTANDWSVKFVGHYVVI